MVSGRTATRPAHADRGNVIKHNNKYISMLMNLIQSYVVNSVLQRLCVTEVLLVKVQ
jgi:hypothetical protein